MKRKLMLLLTCLFVGIGLVTAQITKVTGTVISEEDGLPVVGASILDTEETCIFAIFSPLTAVAEPVKDDFFAVP